MDHHNAEVARPTSEWDRFLLATRPDVGFKQSTWWAEFLQTRGWGHFGVIVRDGSEIVGGARVLVESVAPGKCYYYVPHGPVLPPSEQDAAEVFAAIIADIDAQRKEEPQVVSHLRLEPRWEHVPSYVHGYRQASGWLEPRDTLCVDLSLSADQIMEQMKPKGRYNMRLARRKGVSVVEDVSPLGVTDFVKMYHETARRQGARSHSDRYIRDLSERLFSQGRGSIFFAEYQGLRLATAMVIYFGDTATYKYGGSSQLHRHTMAPYLLHFEAMLQAKSRHCRWYDFYGVCAPDEPDNAWANISVFKRKFGGREVRFIPALDFVYEDDA